MQDLAALTVKTTIRAHAVFTGDYDTETEDDVFCLPLVQGLILVTQVGGGGTRRRCPRVTDHAGE